MLAPIYTYDLETMPNCFLFCGKFEGDERIYLFEISDRVNERDQLMSHLSYLQNAGVIMQGFNSLSFDYPLLHMLLTDQWTFTAQKAYLKAQEIIGSQSYGLNPNVIRLQDRIIPQLDLVKVNHFDNAAKRISLKSLQFAMRSRSVEDLPFAIRDLTHAEMDELRKYNVHDVTETEKFGLKCRHHVEIRQQLLDSGALTGDVLNFSDKKIGTEYFVKKLGRHNCYEGGRPKQTFRNAIPYKSVILSKIEFRTEKFNEVLEWFKQQTVYPSSKDPTPKHETTLAGLQFHFGLGGVHASVESRKYRSDEQYVIRDIDVSGMYPAIAIANGFFPEHLSRDFLTAYKSLQAERKQYPKSNPMNLVLKLAMNGVYGDSNNVYSPFYDPRYTFSVTLNGQLQLLELVERLSMVPGVELIQANTDGITAYVPRTVEPFFDLWMAEWEGHTGLKLEEVEYAAMWIRDVNNYVALTTEGKVKRKGAYAYPVKDSDYWGGSGSEWHKDFSQLVVPKVASLVMTQGYDTNVVYLMSDPFDFMIRYKTPAGATVYVGEEAQLKTVRYYVSTNGLPMRKVSAARGEPGAYKRRNKISDSFFEQVTREIGPGVWDERIHTKNRSTYESVTTSIESGRLVKVCNDARDFDWSDVDWDYYIKEIEKLVIV